MVETRALSTTLLILSAICWEILKINPPATITNIKSAPWINIISALRELFHPLTYSPTIFLIFES